MNDGITPTDHSLWLRLDLAQLIILVVFTSILALIVASDIRRFKGAGKTPISVRWHIILT
jgi:hypothetical protein